MPDSYRLALCAALGWIALTGTNHPNAKSEAERTDAQQAIANSLDNIASSYRELAEGTKGAEKHAEPCGEGNYSSSADLCAQWKAADSAADSAWWAWAGSVISLLGLVGVLAAVGVAVWSNLIIRRTAKHELRAYLGVREVQAAPDGKDHITARVIIYNFGNTPANKVKARIAGWVGKFPSQMLDGQQPEPDDQICPETLHPGAEFDLYAGDIIESVSAIFDGKQGFYVYGTVSYVDFDGVSRETNFCYRGTESTLMNKGEMRVSFEGNKAT